MALLSTGQLCVIKKFVGRSEWKENGSATIQSHKFKKSKIRSRQLKKIKS